jgi:hypothetical protein
MQYPKTYVESKWDAIRKEKGFVSSMTFTLFNDRKIEVVLDAHFYLMWVLLFVLACSNMQMRDSLKEAERIATSDDSNSAFMSHDMWHQATKV